METVDILLYIFGIIIFVTGVLAAYQVVFIFVGFFGKGKKFKDTGKNYKYAIIVAARNEEKTIGQLFDSLSKQDYPKELLTVFVVADDCQDNTAQIARDWGAIVYERNNPPKKQRRKSFAMKLAFENIARDVEGGIQAFDGYFVFDADNLLAPNYITEMNKAFDLKKYGYFTSYISEKNLETTVVSTFGSIGLGGYYSANLVQHRAASVLGIGPMICGKGYLMRSELLKDGWRWTGLTEDIEARADLQCKGIRGCWVEAAELFDENPHTFKILARQRMRWERGSWIAFCKYVGSCIVGMFYPRDWRKKTKEQKASEKQNAWKPKGFKQKFVDGLQKRFSCYNQFFLLLPRPVIVLIMGFLFPFAIGLYTLIIGNISGLWTCLLLVLTFYGAIYLVEIMTYTAVIIRERHHIRGNVRMMFRNMFIWPFFTMFIQYLSALVMFIPIKWKPIPHTKDFSIEQITGAETMTFK